MSNRTGLLVRPSFRRTKATDKLAEHRNI